MYNLMVEHYNIIKVGFDVTKLHFSLKLKLSSCQKITIQKYHLSWIPNMALFLFDNFIDCISDVTNFLGYFHILLP